MPNDSTNLFMVVERLLMGTYPRVPRSYAILLITGVLKHVPLEDIPQDLRLIYAKAECLLSQEKTDKGDIRDMVKAFCDVLGGASPRMVVARKQRRRAAELSAYLDVVIDRLGSHATSCQTLTRMLYWYYDGELPSVTEFEQLFFDNIDPTAVFSQFSTLAIKMAPKGLKTSGDLALQPSPHAIAWYKAECKRIRKKLDKGVFDILDGFVRDFGPAALPVPGAFIDMTKLDADVRNTNMAKSADYVASTHLRDYAAVVNSLVQKHCNPVVDAVAKAVGILNLPSPQKMAYIIKSCDSSNVHGRLSDVVIAVICGGNLGSILRASDAYSEAVDGILSTDVLEIVKVVGLDALPCAEWLRRVFNDINDGYCGPESRIPSKLLAERVIWLMQGPKDVQIPPSKPAEVEAKSPEQVSWEQKYLSALAVTGEHYSVAKEIVSAFVEKAKNHPDLKEMPTPAQFKEAVAKARSLHPTWEGSELSSSVLLQVTSPLQRAANNSCTQHATRSRLEHGYPLIFVNTTESSVEVYCQTLAVGGVAITSPKYLLPKSVASDAAVDAAIDQAVSDTVAAVNAHEKKGGTNG